jgi:ssDNA-binding Zn-finger/Zn-ribbon topoisomerase 1
MGIHIESRQFYIGYREYNVKLNTPSHVDLFNYRTSSTEVKPIFDQYDWYIIAEFWLGIDAYDFEQLLIFENWDNPLLLNYSCFHGKPRFRREKDPWNKGKTGLYYHSEESKGIIREKRALQVITDEHRHNISLSLIGNTRALGKLWTEDTRKTQEIARSNIPESTRIRASEARSKAMTQWHLTHDAGFLGGHHTDEAKEKQAAAQRHPKPKCTCPHCGKVGGVNVMQRHHFENCKLSPTYVPPTSPKLKSHKPYVLKLVTCPHCGKEGKGSNMTQRHFDNCKFKKLL